MTLHACKYGFLKSLSDQIWIRYLYFSFFKLFIFNHDCSVNVHFLLKRNKEEIYKTNTFRSRKKHVIFHHFDQIKSMEGSLKLCLQYLYTNHVIWYLCRDTQPLNGRKVYCQKYWWFKFLSAEDNDDWQNTINNSTLSTL